MKKIDVYIGEIEAQIEFSKLSYKNFEESYAKNNTQETFMHIHHFLIHISNIDKTLDVRKNQLRESILGKNLTNADLKPFRRIRNHLEHFDERLDKWVKEYDGHTFFDMNFIQGAKGFPKKAFLRALDGKIMKFQGEDYDLESLNELLSEVESDIKKLKN